MPALARSLGQSMRILKRELGDKSGAESPEKPAENPAEKTL